MSTAPSRDSSSALTLADPFAGRHIGPDDAQISSMLTSLELSDLDALIERAVPSAIAHHEALRLPEAIDEAELLAELRALAEENRPLRSFIGLGYHGTFTPPVIQRNILENPGWYTAYTPYQAEIAQGRLEALLNFQTMVIDLCGMEVANASLLDEGTAAAEAMTMCQRVLRRHDGHRFYVAEDVHPQTLAVLRTRAEPLGIEIVVGAAADCDFSDGTVFGCLVQYPATDGAVRDYAPLAERAHEAGALLVVAADLLALTLLRPPGEFGADIVVGSAQRLGVPMGYGGPHAAFMATRESFKRQMPGRIIGLSVDAQGNPALRMALQTREQHIRREKATSNICTAQVLLAVMAGMYGVWHGPEGLRRIAGNVRRLTLALSAALREVGCSVGPESDVLFDTLKVAPPAGRSAADVLAAAVEAGMNLRDFGDGHVGVTLDETATSADLRAITAAFAGHATGGAENGSPVGAAGTDPLAVAGALEQAIPSPHARSSDYMTHPVFNTYRSETEMQRYLRRLEARDLSLTTSMIPLGSCTMKLNAAAEMMPVSFPGLAGLHPFAPLDQAQGYAKLFARLEEWLAEITGFDAYSLQPNAGSQGEYTGLLTIRAWHLDRGDAHRDVCLIPTSAHGTNPASAIMAGMRVVAVACDDDGNIDLDDLRARIAQHGAQLSALMVTYPSTHGVFETTIREICELVHEAGGQVYLDGANMNALVGTARPGDFGADVCHLNLHKTFCIPHGGGGPGVGPIGVQAHLAPYLPGHPLVAGVGGDKAIGPVASAPWGSASILPISYAYIRMMGPAGLRRATEVAILNANYIAKRLAPHYPVLYTGPNGLVAHECIIDVRFLKDTAGIEVDDIAKRLMDYGFHAPTMSWPVSGTLMIEPTESEDLGELDRFCDAMIAIRDEIRAVEEGRADAQDNVLKHAPHTVGVVTAEDWSRPYSRQSAAFPAPWQREHKYWPHVARVDNVYGDRHLVCACPPVEAFAEA
jgi:glycine dehydrogenase